MNYDLFINAAPKPPPEPPKQEVLLTKIRDLLKAGRS